MFFLAPAAFIAQVGFLAGFPACHAPFADCGLAVLAFVAAAHSSAGLDAFFAPLAKRVGRASCTFLAFRHFVFCVFVTEWTMPVFDLWELHECFGHASYLKRFWLLEEVLPSGQKERF